MLPYNRANYKTIVIREIEPSDIASGYVKWYSHFGNTIWQFSERLNIALPPDLEIQFLVTDPRAMSTQKLVNEYLLKCYS